MLIDILLTSLSMFTSSQRATVSRSRLHRRMRLVHAKRPPRQRLSRVLGMLSNLEVKVLWPT
jgi:hypothetical protein